MVEEKDYYSTQPLVNLEKLQYFLSLYRLPLLFVEIGIVFFAITITLLVKNQTSGSQVTFSTESTQSARVKFIVDVEGAVINPGIYEFFEGSRISEALTKAGGLSANADRVWLSKNLNKAAKLIDGGKIYIPSVDEITSGKAQNSIPPWRDKNPNDNLNNQNANVLGGASRLINVNTASISELDALPGVGPITAGKIIDGRPYQVIEELRLRKIVRSSTFEKIKDLIAI